MRNARRSGGGLVEQAELASDTVFYQHRGSRHVATLLLELDTATGRVRAVDAGSPHVLRLRGGHGRAGSTLEQQLPLGMFAETRYEVQEFDCWSRGTGSSWSATGCTPPQPGGPGAVRRAGHGPVDAGDSAAAGDRGGWYGDARTARLPRGRGSRDDAVVVCLDWRGPARAGDG